VFLKAIHVSNYITILLIGNSHRISGFESTHGFGQLVNTSVLVDRINNLQKGNRIFDPHGRYIQNDVIFIILSLKQTC
jgi:hypothetical protein